MHAASFPHVLVAVTFAAVALAGCVADTDQETGDEIDQLIGSVLPAQGFFGERALVGPGGDAETSLFVGDDGDTILACSHGGFRKPSPMWASTDGGATFIEFFPGPNPVPSGDCDVGILADGSWVMIYDTIASTTVAVSQDEGATWQTPNFGSALPVGGVDRPWVEPDGNDILLTYANVMAAEPALHFFARSTDHGMTFPEQTLIYRADSTEQPNAIIGHMFAYGEDNRTIRVPIARSDLTQSSGDPTTFLLVSSTDGGQSWTTAEVAGPMATSFPLPSASRSETGRIFYALSQDNGSAADIMVVWSDDDGKTWSEPLTVASDVNFPGVRAPWIDARSDGTATLAWLHEDTGDEPGWETWSARVAPDNATDPVVFVGPVSEPVDEPNLYEFIMVDHGPDDRAHILYLVTGEGCKDADPASTRSAQCVWLVSEAA